MLTIDSAPEGWTRGNYTDDPNNSNLYEYIDCPNHITRAAVFYNFTDWNGTKDKGYGVYVFVFGNRGGQLTQWTRFGPLVGSRKEAVHMMVSYAQLGAFDVYT